MTLQVYFFGHHEVSAASPFIALTVAKGNSSRRLTLTANHFLAVDGVLTYAADARVGGTVGLASDDSVQIATIVAKQLERGTGLYNPYTKVMLLSPLQHVASSNDLSQRCQVLIHRVVTLSSMVLWHLPTPAGSWTILCLSCCAAFCQQSTNSCSRQSGGCAN